MSKVRNYNSITLSKINSFFISYFIFILRVQDTKY